jgi:5'-methylthioadenosine phosphorylase
MTAMPEAKLAMEAQLPFCSLSLATDYDCWREAEESVTVDVVLATLKRNVSGAKSVLVAMAGLLPDPSRSPSSCALAGANLTSPGVLGDADGSALGWIIDPSGFGNRAAAAAGVCQ